MLKVFCVFGFILVLCHARTSEKLKVKLPDGSKMVGRYLTTLHGRGIRAFMGVPYAEPPVGSLRFKAPLRKQPWDDTLKAYHDPPMCIQRDPFRRDVEVDGSEDCLYLNVYSPEVVTKPLPVMVFFHGGGFMCGSGIKPFYGPDYLLEHDVVFIGANFRLGPLGFMSTGQEDAWGNFGLKDQNEVLRWIKDNIAAFGGDPNLVTIFGESAGGASVTYHMQSELSKGLFHRGISQSGTNLAPWGAVAHKEVAKRRAIKLGEMMSCPLENSDLKAMVECLKEVPAANITKAFYDFFEWDTDPMVPFPPVIEPNHPGAFLTENPRFKTNMHGNSIPWLTGITSEEGAMKSSPLIYNSELTRDLLKNWKRALSISLYYDHHAPEKQQEITREIDEFYFKNQKLNSNTQQNLTNLYTDGWFFHAMIDYLQLRFSDESSSDTFVYLFTHKGACSFTEIFKGGSEAYYGTSHAEELQYLFPIRQDLSYFFNSVPTEQDKEVTKIITKLWVNFAYSGNPTPAGEPLEKWTATSSFPLNYMRIGNENGQSDDLIVMQHDLYPERAQFWDEIRAHHPAKELPNNLVKGEL